VDGPKGVRLCFACLHGICKCIQYLVRERDSLFLSSIVMWCGMASQTFAIHT
jgi:hypothetical protein